MQTHADLIYNVHTLHTCKKMTAVGFEPTQLALVELESAPVDHLCKLSLHMRQTCCTCVKLLHWLQNNTLRNV